MNMLRRYSNPQMAEIWSEENKFRNWVRVEAAVLRAKKALGMIPHAIPNNLEKRISINVEEIYRIESDITKHDVIAFLMHTSSQLPKKLQPHWHNGMTSYDTQDTGLSLQLVASVDALFVLVGELAYAIKDKALIHKNYPMIGRTHGVHAEPITFGVKLANWYDEIKRHYTRLAELRRKVAVGKISGAVGMYTLDPEIEKLTCSMLGLGPIIATQIISRDIIAEYLSTIALIGGTIEKIGVNIRTLQRSEIREVQEYFSSTQRGSSAMPHKRNPIGSENVSGLARVLRGYDLAAMENQNTWDERDLANSGAERIILPDASILLAYMLARLTKIIKGLVVNTKRMRLNIGLTKGLVFSQNVQSLYAAKSKMPREDAYRVVQEIAQRCWDEDKNFVEALLNDTRIKKVLNEKEIMDCFDLDGKLVHTSHIFREVFGQE
jgi:adenylosuccinate lyase